jgi:hypothetical protein
LNNFFKNYLSNGYIAGGAYGSNANSATFGNVQVQVLPTISNHDYSPQNQGQQQYVQPIPQPQFVQPQQMYGQAASQGQQFFPSSFVGDQRNDQFVQPINVNQGDVRRIDQYQQQVIPQGPQFVPPQNIRTNDNDDRRYAQNGYVNNNPYYSIYPTDDQI